VIGAETNYGPFLGAVVIATGGFERHAQFRTSFLRGPAVGLAGAPGARGDGLLMGMSLGAALGNMSEAWWAPCIRVPGDSIDGEPLWRFLSLERASPGSIMVDQRGRRFCNEAGNYSDVGRALHSFDPNGFRFDRDPTWLIFDEEYRRSYGVASVLPGEPAPTWWKRASSIDGLAAELGVPPAALERTVSRFNDDAERGIDSEFGRGSSTYDRFVGDEARSHPSLGALKEPPYYALEVRAGLLGTKGGLKTDACARVLRVRGGYIKGLYAAGNASANCFGLAYPGAGGTIGPALAFGEIAGESAAAMR